MRVKTRIFRTQATGLRCHTSGSCCCTKCYVSYFTFNYRWYL